jgi:hypothetical protein
VLGGVNWTQLLLNSFLGQFVSWEHELVMALAGVDVGLIEEY